MANHATNSPSAPGRIAALVEEEYRQAETQFTPIPFPTLPPLPRPLTDGETVASDTALQALMSKPGEITSCLEDMVSDETSAGALRPFVELAQMVLAVAVHRTEAVTSGDGPDVIAPIILHWPALALAMAFGSPDNTKDPEAAAAWVGALSGS